MCLRQHVLYHPNPKPRRQLLKQERRLPTINLSDPVVPSTTYVLVQLIDPEVQNDYLHTSDRTSRSRISHRTVKQLCMEILEVGAGSQGYR